MVPYRQFNHADHRVWSNLMSGDWAWKQAVCPFLFIYLVRALIAPVRISSPQTPPTTAARLFQLLVETTRRQCLSPRGTKNTIRCMPPREF
jgi:hypothetical protein